MMQNLVKFQEVSDGGKGPMARILCTGLNAPYGAEWTLLLNLSFLSNITNNCL